MNSRNIKAHDLAEHRAQRQLETQGREDGTSAQTRADDGIRSEVFLGSRSRLEVHNAACFQSINESRAPLPGVDLEIVRDTHHAADVWAERWFKTPRFAEREHVGTAGKRVLIVQQVVKMLPVCGIGSSDEGAFGVVTSVDAGVVLHRVHELWVELHGTNHQFHQLILLELHLRGGSEHTGRPVGRPRDGGRINNADASGWLGAVQHPRRRQANDSRANYLVGGGSARHV